MATATQPRQLPQTQMAAGKPADDNAALLDKVVDKTSKSIEIEYTPFQSEAPITLTVARVRRFLAAKTKSGKEASEEDVIKFMMLCKSRKLNPWEGDAYIVGYDTKDGARFSLITAHQSFLKRAELHPEYDGMESGVIVQLSDGSITEREGDFYLRPPMDNDGNPIGNGGEILLGGWCKVYFKSRSRPMFKRLHLATFNKGVSQWITNPAGMIVKCAEADALRSSFPTMLGGLYLRDEFDRVEATPSAPEQPPELPKNGRHSFRGIKAPPQPVVSRAEGEIDLPPSNGDTQPPEQAPQTVPVDQGGLDDLLSDLREGIAKAEGKNEMEAIVEVMRKNEEWMGADNYRAVSKAWHERNEALKGKAKK